MRPIPFSLPPPGELLHAIQAPGFVASPPDVRQIHLIPRPQHEAMQPAWSWGEYAPATVGVYRLRDVVVADEGLVFLADGSVVDASVTQHQPEEIAEARAAIAAGGLEAVDGPVVLCVKRGARNYGHWLGEMLPMGLLANRVLGDGVRYLVPRHEGALGQAIRDALELAGIGAERVVKLGVRPCRVRELIMVHGLSIHGLYLSPLVPELLQDLVAPVAASHPGCSVWVSRAGAPRCLWGERDLGTVLHLSGWRVVHPGAMRFVDQVALFKGAARICGVMGAGMANLLFAAPGSRVEMLTPADMPDTFFYLISQLRQLRYRETRCVTGVPVGAMPWDGAVVAPLPDLMAMLG